MIEGDARPVLSIPGDYKEIMLFRQKRGNWLEIRKNRYLPAEKHPYLLLCFYDTYYLYLESISFV